MPGFISDEDIAEALRACGGIQRAASGWLRKNKGVIITQQGISKRVKNSEMLKRATFEGLEAVKDIAESKLFNAITNGNLTSIIFFLKTKAKERGYVEKQELEGKVETVQENPFSKLSREELKELLK